ncbi:hypothetical protein M513_14190 [Trichuris suis]|uniref:Uncharacterized protein n=1 Tax=Trichuris suis TaxID=68888 RepID=A0A085LIY8_9BILA|nr:hypothetical protein M513_14190 [Trichuris suis]
MQSRVVCPSVRLDNARLKVSTNRSTWPLDCGMYGAVHMCRIPLEEQNRANSDDTNCLPLSVTSTNGTPWCEKMVFNASITLSDVILSRRHISGHFEKESTRRRYMRPSKGPAKSA